MWSSTRRRALLLLRGGGAVGVAVAGTGGGRSRSCLAETAHSKIKLQQGRECLSQKRSHDGLDEYDVGIIGGGIVGLAVAREFKLRHPRKSMVLLEKEGELATAQTGHNSGVIHAGMYYKPGSMKAKLCVEGAKLTYQYCKLRNIPFKQVGKLIVAVDESEIPPLMDIYDRALANKVVGVEWLNSLEEIREVEPHCVGLKAIHCRSTGIVDWKEVALSYANDFIKDGGVILLNHEVVGIESKSQHLGTNRNLECYRKMNPIDHKKCNGINDITIMSKGKQAIKVRHLITCSGMYSDRISKMTGGSELPKMIPFRGEYLLLRKEKANLINGNIYPVPNPKFPFLGVHFTPRINGEVWLGPNAILSFSREGYSYSDINLSDLYEILTFKGMIHIAIQHGAFGLSEIFKSLVMRAQVRELRRYVPDLQFEDVTRGPSGVRAQAVDIDGGLVEDFVFDENSSKGILHVRNAPSPGATSSLAIAKFIVDKAEIIFDFGISAKD